MNPKLLWLTGIAVGAIYIFGVPYNINGEKRYFHQMVKKRR